MVQESKSTLIKVFAVKLPQQWPYVRSLEQQIRDQQFPLVQYQEERAEQLTNERNVFRRDGRKLQEETMELMKALDNIVVLQAENERLNVQHERERQHNQMVVEERAKVVNINERLHAEIKTLKREYETLNGEYYKLAEREHGLIEKKESLADEVESLADEVESLADEVERLAVKNRNLEEALSMMPCS